MTQPAKAHEPSMEEILASIRRIIADDDAKPEPPAAAPAVSPQAPPERSKGPAVPAAGAAKPAPAPKAAPSPIKPVESKPQVAPAATAASNNQDDIDALLAGLDAETSPAEIRTEKPAAPSEDVLELTEQMAVDEPGQPSGFRNIEAQDDLEFTEAAPPAAPERPRTMVSPPPSFNPAEAPPAQAPLMSAQTTTAVNSAFNALAQTVLSNNARTLEDLVKEMLRPMLKSWLDDNLPGLVEKIVRAEIERVSRGR